MQHNQQKANAATHPSPDEKASGEGHSVPTAAKTLHPEETDTEEIDTDAGNQELFRTFLKISGNFWSILLRNPSPNQNNPDVTRGAAMKWTSHEKKSFSD